MDWDMIIAYVAAFIELIVSVIVMMLFFSAFKFPKSRRNLSTVLITKIAGWSLFIVNHFFIDASFSDAFFAMLVLVMLIIEPLILGFLVRDVDNRPKPIKTLMIAILGNLTMLLFICIALLIFFNPFFIGAIANIMSAFAGIVPQML